MGWQIQERGEHEVYSFCVGGKWDLPTEHEGVELQSLQLQEIWTADL
jgi:hypothetical protein